MATVSKILVVVDPTSEQQPALRRAADIARRAGAELELFICQYDQYLSGERFFDSVGLQKARNTLLADCREQLEALAAPLRADGLRVDVDVRWDHPLDEGIVRQVLSSTPDLVIKDTHFHPVLKRSVFSNTDWNLIRSCPAPLMLVKPREFAARPTVVAAVDPLHEHDKPAELDRLILSQASSLTELLDGELHVFHSFDPTPAIAGAATTMATPIAVPVSEVTEALEKRHRQALNELLADYPLPQQQIHMHQGTPQDLLPVLTEKRAADLVVLGAVSRSGLKRIFIGSTAERVLDQLPCDLLILKPAGFKSRVSAEIDAA
jgi:universal stress protein E